MNGPSAWCKRGRVRERHVGAYAQSIREKRDNDNLWLSEGLRTRMRSTCAHKGKERKVSWGGKKRLGQEKVKDVIDDPEEQAGRFVRGRGRRKELRKPFRERESAQKGLSINFLNYTIPIHFVCKRENR